MALDLPLRGKFTIDPDGKVQAFEILTPSGRKPSKTTLKPAQELVDKVWGHRKVDEAFDD